MSGMDLESTSRAGWSFMLAVAGVAIPLGVVLLSVLLRRLRSRPLLLGGLLIGALGALLLGIASIGWISEGIVRAERPVLVPPLVLILAWSAWRLTRIGPGMSLWRRRALDCLLTLVGLAIASTAAGLELEQRLDRLSVIVALDRSRSMDLVAGYADRVRAELQVAETGMRPDDQIGVIAFAADTGLELPLRHKGQRITPQTARIARDATDIGRAINRALAEVPPDSAARIVLISDGVATRGDVSDAAAQALAASIPIDAVPLDQRPLNNVRLVSVRGPSHVSQGESFELRVVTRATQKAPLEVRLYRDGELHRTGELTVRSGEDVFSLKERETGPGLHRYEVQITSKDPAHDAIVDDNKRSSFVRVKGPALALVLDRDPSSSEALVRALEAASFIVNRQGLAGAPASAAEFAAYDLVTLADIPAYEFSPAQLNALASYVRDSGGGLLLMGSDQAFGPGGYGRGPIEEISPVSFDLKQDRRRASLAEIIAIDYSGSMSAHVGRHTKLELANEAAVRSAELLGSGDRLGVMHVDTEVSWTLPLQDVSDSSDIARRIRSVKPGGGGILVDLTLSSAYNSLRDSKTSLKHVLLFADGGDAEQMNRAEQLVRQALRERITTSVVALGKGHDIPTLERLSTLGDGRFYLIEDARRLPSVFAQETVVATRSSLNEVVFSPIAASQSRVLAGFTQSAVPPLLGYVVTLLKPRAEALLLGPEGDPILAQWPLGIGRVAAFTSDFEDRWGVQWTGWSGATRLFSQLGSALAREQGDPDMNLQATTESGSLQVRARVTSRGSAANFKSLTANVTTPEGTLVQVPLEAEGAGSYSASIAVSRPGAYLVTAVDNVTQKPLASTAAALNTGEELRATGSNRAVLSRIARDTHGKVRDTLAGIFLDRGEARFAYRPLSDLLALVAALSLLFAVATRRLRIPEAWITRYERWRSQRRTRPAPTAPPPPAKSVAHALLDRKASQRKTQSGPRADEPPRPRAIPSAHLGGSDGDATRVELPPVSVSAARERRPARSVAPVPSETSGLTAAEILLARRRNRRK